ncbi:MAG TPA: methyl-accepting chemotaxis protein [Candidatus Binatia bacterium]|jgi:methyl-accepting chemotaxis protein
MKAFHFLSRVTRVLPGTLRGKLTFWFLTLSLMPILAIGIFAYINSRASLESEIMQKLSAIADNKLFTLKGWIYIHRVDIVSLAQNNAIKDFLAPLSTAGSGAATAARMERAKILVESLQQTNPLYLDILVTDPEGKIILASSPTLNQTGKTLSEIGLPKMQTGRTFVSPVFVSTAGQQPVYLIVSPVTAEEKLAGFVALETDLSRMQALTEERSGLGETGEVMIVDRDYRMLTRSRFDVESPQLAKIPEVEPIQLAHQGKRGEAFFKDHRGLPVLGAFRPFSELDSVLVAKMDTSESLAPIARLRNTVIAIVGFTVLLLGGASLFLARSISRPIIAGAGFAQQVANGNLTATLPGQTTSEINLLAKSLNKMVEDLNQIVTRITDVVQNTSAAAMQISAALTEQDQTIASQAVSINEITTTINELAQSSMQVGKTAEEMAAQWREALQTTERGNLAIQKGIEEMNLLKSKTEGIALNILQLSEQIQKISTIVHTVSDIAEQTNMLALNAAIEAARAGEHGKGFSVVATEVRKLADQSQKAAGQIAAIIQEVQAAARSSIFAVEEGKKGVESGVEEVLHAGETLQTVTSTIKKTVESTQEITLATRQQALGVEQVSEGMRSIDQAMKETVAGSKHANTAASQLVHYGQSLQDLIRKFQVADGDFGTPIRERADASEMASIA